MGVDERSTASEDTRDLRAWGIPATARRLLVLEALARQTVPRSANEIHVELRAHGVKIGLTTVYRALATLSQTDLVHAFERGGETVYLKCGEHRHIHLICRTCGQVLEAELPALRGPAGGGRVTDFLAEEVYGTCGGCRSRTFRTPPPRSSPTSAKGPR
ncbi:Fur family transcriptional regulator [Actinomadura rudentiformis]|uniref:Transcriptional repressor n=1 Tax=Actinomadura rudentiformis TaxID=359158 RepID=A0A6H9YPQ3_9ACTN|nr:Fur family transcriptional regulator [Actinomadura rudentiformis]KAB2349703.1 transcriptional repressor [Actinomadura rudentiformis]